MKSKSETLRLPVTVTLVTVLIVGLGITGWFIRPQSVMSRVHEVSKGTELVEVGEIKTGGLGGLLIAPRGKKKETTLIFYPGARVPAKAYAPVVLEIAEEGYQVFLVDMPLNLAILGWKKAGKIISSQVGRDKWVMAGHSMGGAMAARFVAKTDYSIKGLVLWASYPPEGTRFPADLKVLSITGGKDKIINREKLARTRGQLPESAEFYEIEGGNHSQFGWYGLQSGDGQASISRTRQTELIARVTTNFLDNL